eukprot:765783-Hanusia_phi.AAC.4
MTCKKSKNSFSSAPCHSIIVTLLPLLAPVARSSPCCSTSRGRKGAGRMYRLAHGGACAVCYCREIGEIRRGGDSPGGYRVVGAERMVGRRRKRGNGEDIHKFTSFAWLRGGRTAVCKSCGSVGRRRVPARSSELGSTRAIIRVQAVAVDRQGGDAVGDNSRFPHALCSPGHQQVPRAQTRTLDAFLSAVGETCRRHPAVLGPMLAGLASCFLGGCRPETKNVETEEGELNKSDRTRHEEAKQPEIRSWQAARRGRCL